MKRRSDFRSKIGQHPPLELAKACKLAGIRIKDEPDELRISSVFNVLGDGNPGLLLFTVLGVFIGTVSIIESQEIYSTLLGCILGFGIACACVTVIAFRFTNYFCIRGNRLESINGFTRIKFYLLPGCSVFHQMESEYTKLSKGTGSWHRIVDIFINSPNSGKHRIMDFQVEEKDSGLAIQLGNEIVRLVKKRLPS